MYKVYAQSVCTKYMHKLYVQTMYKLYVQSVCTNCMYKLYVQSVCTNLASRRFGVTMDAVDYQQVLHNLSSCLFSCISYAARREQTPLCIVTPAACVALPYFSTLSHKQHDCRKKILNVKCVLIFCTAFVRNTCHLGRIHRCIVTAAHINVLVSCPLFVSDFNGSLILYTDFRKKCSDIKFRKNTSGGIPVF